MKRKTSPMVLRVVVCVAMTAASTVLGVAPGPRAAAGQEGLSIESLGWMAGCWEGHLSGGSLYEEVWLAPRGGVMLGVSRTLRDGKAVGHEFLRIAEEGGPLVYHADPSGQIPTPFEATEIGYHKVTFANPEHDFPQRILYRLEPPDRLLARIEGDRDGRPQGVDFPLRRTACPQGAQFDGNTGNM